MSEPASFTHYYGLVNQAGKAYIICRDLLPHHSEIVFVSKQDLDDFQASAHTFIPAQAQALAFPSALLGQIYFLYQLVVSSASKRLISIPYEVLQMPFPAPAELRDRAFYIRTGEVLRRAELLNKLEELGYCREEYTEVPGQYAVRGSVVDIFCLDQAEPLRIYFAGNRVESIHAFDIDSHETCAVKDQALIIPLRFKNTPATLADYLPGAFYVFDEPAQIPEGPFYANAAIFSALPIAADSINSGLKANLFFGNNLDLLCQEIHRLRQAHFSITIGCLNRGEWDRIGEVLSDRAVLDEIRLDILPLTQGFIDGKNKQAFITSNEIFNRRFSMARALKNLEIEHAKRVRFKELAPGDYIVHRDHGIGRYLGLEIMHPAENPIECLAIEYRNNSKLYVPMYDFKKVQKYISAGGKRPALASLGGTRWQEAKKRVKEEAQKAAKEILRLEALRQATPAPVTPGDVRMEQEFADSFPYELTPGQQQAITETLRDLDLPKPMDRVLIGDVGFGKTEVAMRAALKVALSGKQVMVLVPTTILADQHYKTFTKRMAGFPVNIRMLCRFQTAQEQKKIIAELKNGLCDIIIGTHRLFSKDIACKALGLVIIDEEHRFGVKQKEKIRAISAGVHCLMLSATPIPRTLNQSLSSLRDISLIDTPPRGRTPIKTVVTAWRDELAAAAIQQELARGGQVYYVYNAVRDMQERLEFLRKLVPQARICMAHGQMPEKELEQTLWDFNQGHYDVLLASTIIESGIDITNANTLIVEDAQDFGLAQLYQLRGRIGRGEQKAYCYLFHPNWLFQKDEIQDNYADLAAFYWKPKPEKDATSGAKERLAALMEFGELGSGFRLALRDMEIRGAGDLLGVRQHGYVNEVGLTLYCDLVAAEVKKLKGQPVERQLQAKVNLPVAAFIPPDYLPDEAERLKTYKELMTAEPAQTANMVARLQDQCGPLPAEVNQLIEVIALSRQAGQAGIYQIDWVEPSLVFLFALHAVLPANLPQVLLVKYGPQQVQFLHTRQGYGLQISCPKGQSPFAFAQQFLGFLNSLKAV